MAQTPVFLHDLVSAEYKQGDTALPLDGTAQVSGGGTVSYQWQRLRGGSWEDIPQQTGATYTPNTSEAGIIGYRVIATNRTEAAVLYPGLTLYPALTLYPGGGGYISASAVSNTAYISVVGEEWTEQQKVADYMAQLSKPFVKLCRLRFLQPDGSTAFALDNNPLNRRSGAFIQSGSLTVNLQNGKRRTAEITLANLDGEYDYNVNHIWFGQEIAIDEGLVLSNGADYYIQQGVFVIENPKETLKPGQRTAVYPLADKWSNLDGTLGGNLESTYRVDAGTNIFTPLAALLKLDRGNGQPIDGVTPVFTEYYNGKTQALPDGTSAALTDAPYTLLVDSETGSAADVALGLAEMVNAWIGYDPAGALRLDPSQDDILDADKPVLWRFSPESTTLLGADYTIKNTEVYNDYIILGEALDGYAQPAGRAQNLDPASDTNVYRIGRKTKRESAAGYYTKTQCRDLAEWKLKRATALQKSVSISCSQIFHIQENTLVEIVRTDKSGSPVERHLVMGFTRPLTSTGEMTVNAVSVNDYPIATLTEWPEEGSDETT